MTPPFMAVVELAREEEDSSNDAAMPLYAAIEDGVMPLHEAAINYHDYLYRSAPLWC